MIYPANFETKIGFDQIRQQVMGSCISAMGVERAEKMCFSTSKDFIETSLMEIDEMTRLMQGGLPFPVRDYYDLREEFAHIQIEGTSISLESLFWLKPSLHALRMILNFAAADASADYPRLRARMSGIAIDRVIFDEVNRLVDDKGEMPDNASPELLEIRRDIKRKRQHADRRIKQILTEAKDAGWVDAKSEITIREGRMVIPVKAGSKRALHGFIHDESATGQTVYIEPSEIFDSSNAIRELEYAERREVNRILLKFTSLLRPCLADLKRAWQLLGIVDFIRAKTLLARDHAAIVPDLHDSPMMSWRQARHPILEQKLKAKGSAIVPLDLHLDADHRILVISGPNAGGKSVCLKTTGLIQYMLQCGLAVPMRQGSECGLFHHFFLDIGDEQSLENDLSTYSSHLINMNQLLEHSDERSLFLIDEFGTGTEPQIGGSIAEAVLLELNRKRVFGVVTTHYANLKLLADNNEGIVNGAMLFDTRYMQPMYMLSVGKPGSSFAFEIAKKIGFSKKILEEASRISGDTHLKFERQLQQLEIEKKEVRKKQRELAIADSLLDEVVTKYKNLLAELENKKRQLMRDAAKEAQELIDQANKKIEHTIKAIREAQAEKTTTKMLRAELRSAKDEIAEKANKASEPKKVKEKQPSDEVLKVGDTVCIEEMQIVGELVHLTDTDATVLFDAVKLRTSIERLKKVTRKESRQMVKRWQSGLSDDLNEKAAKFDLTLDVRGKRAEEALDIVAKYLDEAKLLSIKEVSILHGKGNGVLRRLIREFLSHQHDVERFQDASLETGGAGITRVWMR